MYVVALCTVNLFQVEGRKLGNLSASSWIESLHNF